MMATATAEQIEKFSLRAGDTIITKDSETSDDIAISAYVPNDLPGVVCGYHLSMVRPKSGGNGRFLKRFFDSQIAKAQAAVTANGLTRVGLGQYAIDNLHIAVPPLVEQVGIGAFLDRETAKIDALVAEQEQLITLLKEKRQAVISHAVTKGLDPSVPMKDSDVEWLGEVPAHWEIKKVSLVFRARKGSNAAALTKEYCATIEGEYPVYSGQTENAGVMASISSYEFDAHEAGVLFSTTVGAKAMTIMHIFGKFSLSQNCMIIAPIVALHVRFFFYHMQPLFQYERGLIPEHMQASFRMEDLYAYRIASPNFDEQISIAKFLDERCAAFDALIDEAEINVSLLKERRSSIISAAVTGQIDVRGLAPAQERAA